MNKFLGLFTISISFVTLSHAQFNRYIIRLKHKGATPYSLSNPSAYLSQRAIDRRIRYGIAIDSTDLPVPTSYIAEIQNTPNVTILNVSRWLTAVTILTNDANAITTINSLPFVQNTSGIASRKTHRKREEIIPENNLYAARREHQQGDYFDYGTGTSFNEIHLHNGEFLHNIGLRGQGMQIAMLDGGFFHYTSLDAFDSANANRQFLSTWDFVARDSSVVEDDSHGMSCLSTIAANIPGLFIGTSPRASFHLFRTEDVSSEYPIEEFNWACGAERADSVGVDLISSSLGYGYDFDSPVADYPYDNLNGDITLSVQAADLAAKKGILVFNAAGNSGNDYWHMITTPADGDSVVAVGAVNSSGEVGAFSSYGPSADGRVKPDLASVGVSAIIETSGNSVAASNGTSFACPKMAGLAACLWQGFPEMNNMQIVQALKETASNYSSPDNRIGYGIPDVKKAFILLLSDYATANATLDACNITLNWTSKDVASMKYEIERKAPGEISYSKIGEINAKPGNILASHNYKFSNSINDVTAGNISYRIRQIIDTNAASFASFDIDVSTLMATGPCLLQDAISIAPNPATGPNAILNIVTTNAVNSLRIFIYNIKGDLIMQISQSKTVGKASFNIPIGNLTKGKYLVKVCDDNKEIGITSMLKL